VFEDPENQTTPAGPCSCPKRSGASRKQTLPAGREGGGEGE